MLERLTCLCLCRTTIVEVATAVLLVPRSPPSRSNGSFVSNGVVADPPPRYEAQRQVLQAIVARDRAVSKPARVEVAVVSTPPRIVLATVRDSHLVLSRL